MTSKTLTSSKLLLRRSETYSFSWPLTSARFHYSYWTLSWRWPTFQSSRTRMLFSTSLSSRMSAPSTTASIANQITSLLRASMERRSSRTLTPSFRRQSSSFSAALRAMSSRLSRLSTTSWSLNFWRTYWLRNWRRWAWAPRSRLLSTLKSWLVSSLTPTWRLSSTLSSFSSSSKKCWE